MVKKKSKPKFNVPNLGFMTGIKSRWRKPRGTGNKKRRKCRWAGKSPRVGYKNAPEVRGLHPLGMPEILVYNPGQVKSAAGRVVRIAAQVAVRKALEIEKAARAAGLVVVNPRKAAPKERKEPKAEAKKTGAKPEAKSESRPGEKKAEAKKTEQKALAAAQKIPPTSPEPPPAPQMKGGSI
jgi:large subunit ribosomal protein L32e